MEREKEEIVKTMPNKEQEFLKRIQETFRIEAEEHLRAFSSGLIELKKTQPKARLAEILETMFREIHSLKGAARSIDHKEVESICQPLEDVFSSLKRREISLSPSFIGLCYKTVDLLAKLIVTADTDKTSAGRHNLRELIQQLRELVPGKLSENNEKVQDIPERRPIAPEKVASTETTIPIVASPISNESVRIRISKLDPLLLQAEEMVQTKIAINQRTIELTEINNEINDWIGESYKWRSHRSRASIALWNEWMDENDLHLNKLESRMAAVTSLTQRDQHSLNRMVDSHLDAMKQILMLPVSSLVEIFPGMVREIAREQNKKIEFIISGEELEIDKRILEELKNPLIHLIRNSIDHGIGKPQERIKQNKPQEGKISLAFTARENVMIEITLSDDGNGINKEHLLKAAIKSGNLTSEAAEKLGPEEILSLIFQSGVSTSSIITDISGRGLGLSIVREKVEKLNGRILVETELNKGTTFHIILPMTLATFRGILVKVEQFMFILPTMNVERVLKVKSEEIKTVESHETILIDNEIISFVDLGKVLGLPEKGPAGSVKMEPMSTNSNQICVVVIVSGEYRIAFKVDDLVEEQQVLVKGLGKLLSRVKNISGATILGSGKVVPVLNITDLMKSALRIKKSKTEAQTKELFVTKTGKILVAEDSITSRTLIKNILETAGYQVTTSVDGADAFSKAHSGDFDMVVSDVDMPRMNGFELTAKIRQDKKLSEVPVVLITALGSREDREHGIEVGADAYIIKSSFDQTNLLDIIRKLI